RRDNAAAMHLRRPLVAAWSVTLSLAAAGCGVETYEARVKQNSIPFFQYQKELDANLGTRWRQGAVSLRLPAEFKPIPNPKKKDQAARDPRIPPGLNAEQLVGLLGGFRGEVATAAGGQSSTGTAYAMVLSNGTLLSSRDPKEKPQDFDLMLLNRVAAGLGLGTVSKNTLRPFNVGGKDFQPSLRYDAAAFETEGGAPMRYEVYIHRQAPLQVAVVFALPKSAAGAGRLDDRIALSLQTLRIGDGGPPAGGAAAAGGGSPGF
ncbi:MAG TPA: hypothetical protein VF170_08520, partial [Planctomycetaceae bacterium]